MTLSEISECPLPAFEAMTDPPDALEELAEMMLACPPGLGFPPGLGSSAFDLDMLDVEVPPVPEDDETLLAMQAELQAQTPAGWATPCLQATPPASTSPCCSTPCVHDTLPHAMSLASSSPPASAPASPPAIGSQSRRIMNRKMTPPGSCPPAPSSKAASRRLCLSCPAPASGQPHPLAMATLGRKPRSFKSPKSSPDIERAAFSLMSSPTSPYGTPSTAASSFVILEEGGATLTFTHRRMDTNVSWGLDLECASPDLTGGFIVMSVLPGSVMDAWNNMCAGGPSAGMEVLPGDRVLSTNGKCSCVEMLQEFKVQLLIKFVIARASGLPDCLGSF